MIQQNSHLCSAIIVAEHFYFKGFDKMITVENSGELLIVYIFGEIDHHSAYEMRETVDYEISKNKPKHLILDFKNVTFMDSSGVGLVLGRYRLMHSIKGTLEIREVSKQTKKLFELAGLGSIAIIKEVQK